MQHKPTRRILWSWSAALLLPAGGGTLVMGVILRPFLREDIWYLLLCAVAFILLVFLVVYLPLRLRRLRFSLTGDGLTRTGGVVFATCRRMPLDAVRHVTLLQGPVEHWCGIAYLLVSAAGGHILVEGLDASQAQAWCRRLLPDG